MYDKFRVPGFVIYEINRIDWTFVHFRDFVTQLGNVVRVKPVYSLGLIIAFDFEINPDL